MKYLKKGDIVDILVQYGPKTVEEKAKVVGYKGNSVYEVESLETQNRHYLRRIDKISGEANGNT